MQMFKLCSDEGYAYYPEATSLRSIYAALNQRMMVASSKEGVKSFNIEPCHLFDISELEDSFDCQFVEIPDNIVTAKDFRKWIMETKFE